MPRTWLVLLGICLLAVSVASCRIPTAPLAQAPASAVLYDPKTVDAIAARFPQSAEMKAQNERYRTALAEPVSVVAWNSESSRSQVFYATNRQLDNATGRFGNGWGQELVLGRCTVELPRRERGKGADAPQRTIKHARVFSKGPDTTDEKSAGTVHVALPEFFDESAFTVDLRQVVERAPEHDLLIFVHGFNVDFASSLTRTAQIGIDLPFNGAIVAYSWPSQGGIGNYGADEGIIEQSVAPFVQFLNTIDRAVPPETCIHLLVHSMGNRLVLNGLQQMAATGRNRPRFENLVLAAPDVGVTDFQTLAPAAVAMAKRVTLYVHESDTALLASKVRHRQQRIGDAEPPVVIAGVETIDASAIDTSFMGHSYYGSNRSALSDMFALIKEDRAAGNRRWLKQETDSTGSWWTFAAQPTEVRCTWYFEHLDPKATIGDSAGSTQLTSGEKSPATRRR